MFQAGFQMTEGGPNSKWFLERIAHACHITNGSLWVRGAQKMSQCSELIRTYIMRIYIYYMYNYMYIYICICKKCMHIYIYVCVYVYIYMYVCVHLITHTHT